MIIKVTLLAFITLLLSACGNEVPEISDPHNIIVDGKKMTQVDFLRQYCSGKAFNETCLKVQQAMNEDATKGEIPRF